MPPEAGISPACPCPCRACPCRRPVPCPPELPRRRRRRRCRSRHRRDRRRRGRRRRLFRRVGHLGGRCHGGDDEVAPGDHRPRPLDPLQVAPAHTGIEIEARQIGAELLRDAVRIAIHLDRVADDVQHATALEAGTEALVLEMHRHRHADLLAGCQTLEIHVLRRIRYRMKLHVADQRLRRGAIHLHLVNPRLPPGPHQLAQHRARLQRDQVRRQVRPVNHRGHLARSPCRTRRPLTGSRTRLGLDRHNIGHGPLPQMPNAGLQGCRRAGRGVAEGVG